MLNSFINGMTSMKKLQFGAEKCKKLHIGNERWEGQCQSLSVEKWTEVFVKNDYGEVEANDIFLGEHNMEITEDDGYLGDLISNDGRNIKNVKSRVGKGFGIVNRISRIIDEFHLGNHLFEVAIMLRNCIIVSSMLFNSEAWYNLTKSEISLLETVDLYFLRLLLGTLKSVPKEMLYLETGCVPFGEITRERRLRFLHYLLNEKEESLLKRFLNAQMKNPSKKDWVTTVLNDLKYLNI